MSLITEGKTNLDTELLGGWRLRLFSPPGEENQAIQLYNKSADGKMRWFQVCFERVDQGDGKHYFRPMIDQEPDTGIPFEEAGVPGIGKIVGALLANDDGVIPPDDRFSITRKGLEIADRTAVVDGKEQGHLVAVFSPDANRLIGCPAIFTAHKTDNVAVLEMIDLAQAWLQLYLLKKGMLSLDEVTAV